ncbi:EAL domain-containing protein, partial [Desulfovibrio sp. OttesenSCG-928-C14]|nr:EAL domain-containing protein [Desulfovibrio sp. OttesenSCG-928-C14]
RKEAGAILARLPLTAEEDLEHICAFLRFLGGTLVQLGQKNMKMAERDRELSGITQQLDATNRMLKKFLNSSDVGMYVCDYYTGEIWLVNDPYCRMVGLGREEILGSKCWAVNGCSEDTFCSFCPRSGLLDAENSPVPPQPWVYYNEKFDIWLRCTNQAILWTGGRLGHLVTQMDVTKEKMLSEELARLAFYNQVSALPNGQKLLADLQEAQRELAARQSLRLPGALLEGSAREGGLSLDLICFELSSMPLINDAFGRHTGAALLKEIVAWFDGLGLGNLSLYHTGAHEFCLCVRGAAEESVEELAREIARRFTKPWLITIDGRKNSIFCNVALAILYATREKLLDRDLLSLISYSLDEARKNKRIFIYDEVVDRKIQEHILLERNLKNCINRRMRGFEVHFQPIVELASGTWKGLEALCRWTCPERGGVSPAVFIPEAEHLGLIPKIGSWVLENSVSFCKKVGLDELDGFFLSVNISPLQIMDSAFPEIVSGILRRHGYPGSKLSLEVTESAEMMFNSLSMSAVEKLRSQGVMLALDDFGTGYSSFNNLKNLPVRLLKTERGFIDGIETDEYMQYFFFIMSELAHAADMKLIAEGIETAEQMKIIKSNGADYIQGFYFGRPMPACELQKQLEYFRVPKIAPESPEPETININQWLNGKNAYVTTPNLLKLLNQCMQHLLTASDLDSAINEVLCLAGSHFDLGRAFVFLRERDLVFSNTHEWCSPGVDAHKLFLRSVDVGATAPGLLRLFERDGMAVASNVGKLPQDLYGLMLAQEIRSVALMPMRRNDELLGFIGFDDYRPHEWIPEEIIMLWNLAMLIAKATSVPESAPEQSAATELLMEMLNNTGFYVYVADVESNEILWANDLLISRHELGQGVIGGKCHEVLEGRQQPCPFCKIPELMSKSEVRQLTMEHYNAYRKQSFLVYSSLIQWEGRKALLEYAINITEHKQVEEQVEKLASIDALTGALNRATIMRLMRDLLTKPEHDRAP